MLWNGFDFKADFLDSENIIAKLHLVLQLEKGDPYSHRNVSMMPLTDRIKTSLACLPDHLRPYVLALFANTIYFPNKFSQAVLQHLMNKFLTKNNICLRDIGKRCLVLEQDPTGIVNEFLRRNAIQGRLDKTSFPRIQQVSSFVDLAKQQLNNDSLEKKDLVSFLDRDFWVVLADNSLSGTSLCSDLEKLLDLAYDNNKNPCFVVLIRTLASNANKRLEKLIIKRNREKNQKISKEYGLFLDESYAITPLTKNKCSFFNSSETFDGVLEACKWLANRPEYKNDSRLDDHKKHSRGKNGTGKEDGYDMAFGFKKCGLTFVSSENCPSDSLPLLWYSNPEIYIPPFPRVLSRLGDNNHED